MFQNRFQSGLERHLNEDSDSKLKKYGSESIERFPGPFKLEVFGASGGKKQGGGQYVFTRLTSLASKGSADYILYPIYHILYTIYYALYSIYCILYTIHTIYIYYIRRFGLSWRRKDKFGWW